MLVHGKIEFSGGGIVAGLPDRFYMCVYFKDGQPIGHRGNTERNFPETLHGGEESEPEKTGIKRAGYVTISNDFVNTMMGYLEYVPLILNLAPVISQHMVSHSLQQFLEANCSFSEKSETRIIYDIPASKYPDIRRFQENLQAATSTSRTLPRMLTVGLVASLEYHLNLIMREIAARNPEAIFGREKAISVRDIVTFDSMEELKEHLINDEIDKTQRENFDEQVSWIISKADMEDFRPKYADWAVLNELLERRNLFVHANGVVNAVYLKAHRKYKFPKGKDRALGDELHAGPKYFTSSVHRVIHFGAMLLQVVWRKTASEETEEADKAISDLGYELIVRGQYSLAIRILEFAKNLRNTSSDLRRRMNIVNLANAHALSKDHATALKVLGSEDWSAAGQEFKVCVAAVKGNVEEVTEVMRRIGSSGDVSGQDYQEWPAFYSVRDDARFTDAFRSIFGCDYVPSAKRQAGVAQVLEWIKEQKLDPQGTPEGTPGMMIELQPNAAPTLKPAQ